MKSFNQPIGQIGSLKLIGSREGLDSCLHKPSVDVKILGQGIAGRIESRLTAALLMLLASATGTEIISADFRGFSDTSGRDGESGLA